ncbi:MAG: hypothetical protein GWO07_03375 [Candidatus Dadabacteria bacterium]|nr:hypothetical protein [Candidatus Dadabacteria bacterium]NIS07806.1 hypothetical protein [Candidatus Dadabacteria bacterium]NIV43026.1 hypothetical protein [Candidatus Dadabacteria bacterium]NIY21424.1 hypothetical protein [Candidatus Dadabacteria bacterium]
MKLFTILTFILSIASIALVVNAETIELTDPANIKYAHAVSRAMEEVSSKVMSCIDEGGTIGECKCTECSCKFTSEYEVFKKAYKEALAANPDWDDKVVFYTLEGDPMGYNINFEGLKSQFSSECP